MGSLLSGLRQARHVQVIWYEARSFARTAAGSRMSVYVVKISSPSLMSRAARSCIENVETWNLRDAFGEQLR